MPAFLYYKHLLANKFYQSSEKIILMIKIISFRPRVASVRMRKLIICITD